MIEFIDQNSVAGSPELDLMRIYTTSNQVQAHLIQTRLSEEGINATVVGDFIEQGQPLPSCVEILVPKTQAPTAEKFLKNWNIRTEQTTETEPFSVWTTAAFLFVSVSLVAFIGATFDDSSPWVLGVCGALLAFITAYWLKSQFSSQAKLKQN